jgi:hypothetical protein
VSDINTVVVDSLKALDLERPIREADITECPLLSAEADIAAGTNVSICWISKLDLTHQ